MGDANREMKRAAIYNPYLDTLGGGERYTMTVASVLKGAGWHVEVAWKDPKIIPWLQERLGVDLSGIEVIPEVSKGAGYDFVFWLSDGSIPTLFGKTNILHFQTPFHNVNGRSFLNKIKFFKISKVICNSEFTKSFIDKEYGVTSEVIYPPVAVQEFKPGKKENIILSVGRFSRLQQSKRQDILIEAFKKNSKLFNDWKLVLIGGSDVGGDDYVKYLKSQAQGHRIEILENLPFTEIKKFYAKSKIYWTAAGYGIDEQKEPEKVEHFGITVVEAMAAGCIPVTQRKGGHKETIMEGKNGFLWESIDELESKTIELINDERRISKIARKAQESAKEYSEERFAKQMLEVVD